jgi:hypothetical protein
MMGRATKSLVWKVFKNEEGGRSAKCTLCGKVVSSSGNTTNLSRHLKIRHPNVNLEEIGSLNINNNYLDKIF